MDKNIIPWMVILKRMCQVKGIQVWKIMKNSPWVNGKSSKS
jgi:hypothetical protein